MAAEEVVRRVAGGWRYGRRPEVVDGEVSGEVVREVGLQGWFRGWARAVAGSWAVGVERSRRRSEGMQVGRRRAKRWCVVAAGGGIVDVRGWRCGDEAIEVVAKEVSVRVMMA